MSEHPGKPTAHDFYRLDADAYSAAEAAFKPDPTQASAARLTAIKALGYHADTSLEVSNQLVNLALEQAAPDAYTEPLFDARTQRIVQGLVLDALDALLAQIDTLRQEQARLEARITAQPEIVFTSLTSATIEAQRLAALCEEWYGKFQQAEQDRDAARAALEKYGTHDESCIVGQAGHPCTCGLDAALKGSR